MAKGANYEREICRKLSLWWTKGERDDCFWRSSMSGGRATIRSRQGKETSGHYGDIAATNKIGHKFMSYFTVEIKCGYKKASCSNLFDVVTSKAGAKRTLMEWIKQAKTASKLAKTLNWLLIHKPDRREPIVYMNESAGMFLSSNLEGKHRLFVGHLTVKKYRGQETSVYFMRLSSFLSINPETITALPKEKS